MKIVIESKTYSTIILIHEKHHSISIFYFFRVLENIASLNHNKIIKIMEL